MKTGASIASSRHPLITSAVRRLANSRGVEVGLSMQRFSWITYLVFFRFIFLVSFWIIYLDTGSNVEIKVMFQFFSSWCQRMNVGTKGICMSGGKMIFLSHIYLSEGKAGQANAGQENISHRSHFSSGDSLLTRWLARRHCFCCKPRQHLVAHRQVIKGGCDDDGRFLHVVLDDALISVEVRVPGVIEIFNRVLADADAGQPGLIE